MGAENRREERLESRLAIRLAYGSLDEFIERYALNVSRGGIFVRTRDPRPAGTAVLLDLQIATGEKVLRGRGVVTWTATPSAPGEPHRDPGMGIRFTELDDESRKLLELMAGTQTGMRAGDEPPGPDELAPEQPGFEDLALEPPAAAGPLTRIPVPVDRIPSAGPAVAPGSTPRPRAPGPRVVGIDLGTTNCCVAVADEGKARVLASRQGLATIPSVVAFDAHGRLLVGQPAKAQMVVNPRNTVYGSKRLMGRAYQTPAVQGCRDRFHYEIVDGPAGQAAVRFAGRVFSLPQVAAFMLSEVRFLASAALGEEVSRAVVTVPAYYNDLQRQAVREAGKLAGLEVERIVNEPTAAALAYGYGRGLDQRVLVYDLGGGTFDASVVEIQGDVYEVLSTGGDPFLGGVDFDNQLVDHLVWRFMEEHGFAPPDDRTVWQRIRDAAEETKVALSSAESAVAQVSYLCRDASGADTELRVEVTRAELESITGRLVERTVEVCQGVLAAKGLRPQDLDEVLLVGGQSRMPLVWSRIRQAFGREPSHAAHSDEAVALGAALLADSPRRIDSVVLIDVLGSGIGVGLPGGRMAPVLPRNTRLPAKKTYELATVRDGQTELDLVVFQGDAPQVAGCDYLGTLRISRLPAGPRGAVKVAVEFALSPEGILAVTARELLSGKITEAHFATHDTSEAVRERLRAAVPPESEPPARALPAAPATEPVPTLSRPRRGLLDRLRGRG